MARSSCIYVVQDTDGALVAAFTVKWEAENWLALHRPKVGSWRTKRVRDGLYKEPYDTAEADV